MTNVATNIIGALHARIQRQPTGSTPSSHATTTPSVASHCKAPSSNIPAAIGPTTSPTLPVERCSDINSPRRLGNRCASRPSAGGCHSAAPDDASASASSITAYDGAIAIRNSPSADSSALIDSTHAMRWCSKSERNPPVTLVTPADAERTATMAPTCHALSCRSTAITVVSSGMLLDMRCSNPCAPMSVDAISPRPVRRVPAGPCRSADCPAIPIRPGPANLGPRGYGLGLHAFRLARNQQRHQEPHAVNAGGDVKAVLPVKPLHRAKYHKGRNRPKQRVVPHIRPRKLDSSRRPAAMSAAAACVRLFTEKFIIP